MNLNLGNLPLASGSRAGPSFLPEDYLRRKQERRGNFISLTLFCIVMFGVVAAFFVTNRQWNSVRSLQRDINTRYTAEAKKIEQLNVLDAQKQEMLEKAEITAALIERVPRSILLAELINRMPEQLTLTDLKLSGKRIKEAPPPAPVDKPKPRSLVAAISANPADKAEPRPAAPKPVPPRFDFTVELIGLAAADSHVADYQASLKDCPLLEGVDLVYTGTAKVDDVERRKFRIEAKIRPTADARNIQPLKIPRGDLAAIIQTGPDGKPLPQPPSWLGKHGLLPGKAAAAENEEEPMPQPPKGSGSAPGPAGGADAPEEVHP